MNIADKLANKFMNSKYVTPNYLAAAFEMTMSRERMSFSNGKVIFNKKRYRFIPKFFFRHKIFISDELKSYWDDNYGLYGWYKEPVGDIISWLNNNTAGGSMLVIYKMDSLVNGDYSRICFLRKEDAAAFKLYFK